MESTNSKRKLLVGDSETCTKRTSDASGDPDTSSILRLCNSFFGVSCMELAQSLLGKLIARKLPKGEVLKGRIVETECYPGGEDKASYSYNGRRTAANEPMYMEPGTAFVHMTYGMYFCFNISSMEPGGVVLIRAVEPVVGFNVMLSNRLASKKGKSTKLKPHELTNGPSKLCAAMNIDKNSCNTLDLCTSDTFWVEADDRSNQPKKVVESTRIGIDRAGSEWAGKLYRFYVLGSEFVSKRDLKREALLEV